MTVCFDFRSSPGSSDEDVVHDVQLIYGRGEDDLGTIAFREGIPGAARLERAERRLSAHLRACRTAKIDVDRHPLASLVPSEVVREVEAARTAATMDLYDRWTFGPSEEIERYERETWPFARALFQVEQARIRIDRPFVESQARAGHPTEPWGRFFRQLDQAFPDGWARTRLSPIGGKTGRIRVVGGFNCLGIPHGLPRMAIVSRFPGGRICSFDFNAIDYRCIVQSVGDQELTDRYRGCPDFHAQTAALAFGAGRADELGRKLLKQVTYIYIYGGSDEAASQKTGLSRENVRRLMSMLDAILAPIRTFREGLALAARVDGSVRLPTGRRVPIPADAHPGKVLGLYAQSFSSYVFERSLVAAVDLLRPCRSRAIFPVHDELVVDAAPEDMDRMESVRVAMEYAVPGYSFNVKMKMGEHYAAATE